MTQSQKLWCSGGLSTSVDGVSCRVSTKSIESVMLGAGFPDGGAVGAPNIFISSCSSPCFQPARGTARNASAAAPSRAYCDEYQPTSSTCLQVRSSLQLCFSLQLFWSC